MKKAVLSVAFLLTTNLLLYGLEGYVIKGKISGDAYLGYIYLSYDEIKDSVLVQNNTFEFVGKVNRPVLAWLNLQPPANIAWVYLENSQITVEGHFKVYTQEKKVNVYRITNIAGSFSQKLLDQYREFCNANRTQVNFENLRFHELRMVFAKNPTQPVYGWILGDLVANNPALPYKSYIELYSLLDTVAMQKNDLKIIKTSLRTMNKYAVGQPFIEFKLPNEKEQLIDLKMYSGKIILIDFWASWCGPCREKNPALLKLQSKYHNKKFSIVGISIDKDKDAWHKAIAKDGLIWDNLLDLKSTTTTELGIQAIPFNYLLDAKGKIIAINPTLEKIDLILKEIDL